MSEGQHFRGAVRVPAGLLPTLAAEAETAGLTLAQLVGRVLEDHVTGTLGAAKLAGPVTISEDPLVIVDADGPRTRPEWITLAREALK